MFRQSPAFALADSGAAGQLLTEASKEVADRWKCQYQAEGQKGESDGDYSPDSNCLFAPAPFQYDPGHKPDKNGARRDA